MTTADLRLRPLTEDDERACLDAHAALADDDFSFLLGHDPSRPWHEYVRKVNAASCEHGTPEEWVPSLFLLAEVDGEIVGRTSVRFAMTDWMAIAGGHIGYGILPQHRRRGYATEILRQALVIARAHGVADVLMTCTEDNDASAGVIERCGGTFEAVVDNPRGGPPVRRYWIR